LLDNPATTGRGLATGHVCLAVPVRDGLAADGTLRLTARVPGRSPLDVEVDLARGATQADVLDRCLERADEAGWSSDDGVQTAGTCLALGRVRSLGGDPGETGLALALGLAVRGPGHLVLRIHAEGGPTDTTPGGPGIVLTLVARSPIGVSSSPTTSADLVLESPWTRARDLLDALAARLTEDGWTVDRDADGGVLLRALPGGQGLGTALLTVDYGREGAWPEAPERFHWSLSVR